MYESAKKTSKKLGIHPDTLRRWANEGKIQTIRTVGGHRRYILPDISSDPKYKRNICYCRVSSKKQKDDLERQIAYMQSKYPEHEIISDIGSGLNYKRKGLKAILERASQGAIGEIVVAYKDRLCRFGFEIIEHIIQRSGGKIVVLHTDNRSPSEELAQDLLNILTVFSCRMHGLRKYAHQIKKDQNISRS